MHLNLVSTKPGACHMPEQEFNHYYEAYLKEPPTPALSRMRALFTSEAVDDGARKLAVLIGVLGSTAEAPCITNVYEQVQNGYDVLLDLALQEIDGTPVRHPSPAFLLSTSLSHCSVTPVCSIPAVASDPDMTTLCKGK